ncbi:MAG: S41 family peptidase [Hyphomicrobiales bacterium]
MTTRELLRSLPATVALSALLAAGLPSRAPAEPAASLEQQANKAYATRDFAACGSLYLAAAAEGGDPAGDYYNAACCFAQAGKPDDAFAALERAIAAGFSDTDHAKVDTDLTSLHTDARWQPLLDRAAAEAKADKEFWDGPSMQTPYRPNLSEDEKIAGLSKLWAEAKFNFIYFDRVPNLNWDAVYMEYLPRVRASKSTLEYYRLLIEMAARLKDGHTGVWMPKELGDEVYATPLLRTALVEGTVVVTAVAPSLSSTGIVPGAEIVAIDGRPVKEYARERVAPSMSSSTPQDLDARTYGYALLQGPRRAPVALTLRDAAGRTFTRSVPRVSGAEAWKTWSREPMAFRMLPGNIAYVALNTFNEAKTADMFEAAFPEIAKADALILDVRENGGGNSSIGDRILACLTDRPIPVAPWDTRDYRPTYRAWGRREGRFTAPGDSMPPNGKLLFTKPVVVLTSPRTFSAAEDFSATFRDMKRGRIIGEPTGGSTGQPLSFPLPGGGGARICTRHCTFADGTEFVGVGILPDVKVAPTLADLRAGRDTVLEAALRELGRR